MNYLTVDLFKDFECIADACPNTCCAGWNIFIDKSTYEKMIEHEEELGIPAKDWLIETEKNIQAKLVNQRCCMLNENNLCNVVLKLGPEYLSNTCQQYPRILAQYGNIVEIHLSMSCPEVIAQLMVKESVQFDYVEDKSPVLPYEHANLYLFESDVRAKIVNIIQNFSNITLTTRLFASFKILEKAISAYQNEQLSTHTFNPEIAPYMQENVLHSLDTQLNGVVNEANRYVFLKKLLTVMFQPSIHPTLKQFISQTHTYFSENSYEKYLSDFKDFRASIQTYQNFYTNYWSYRIFSDILTIPNYELAKRNFIYIAAEFCLIQMLALAFFANNNKHLDTNEYTLIISFISREMEHSKSFRQDLTDLLVKNETISVAGLLLMILN